MKKSIKQAAAAPAPEPTPERSPLEILQSFAPQVAAMSQAVVKIRDDWQSTRELIPAAEREALEQAADAVRVAKRELTQRRNELATAQADCQRHAKQNATDDELVTANEAVDKRKTAIRIAHQRYEAALAKQDSAAAQAMSAGFHPSVEKTVLANALKRECMGRFDVLQGEPALRECVNQLADALERLAWSIQLDEQSPGRHAHVREQVNNLTEPPLRIERPISPAQAYAHKLDKEQLVPV